MALKVKLCGVCPHTQESLGEYYDSNAQNYLCIDCPKSHVTTVYRYPGRHWHAKEETHPIVQVET